MPLEQNSRRRISECKTNVKPSTVALVERMQHLQYPRASLLNLSISAIILIISLPYL